MNFPVAARCGRADVSRHAMNHTRLVQIAADAVASTQARLPAEIRAIARSVPVHYEREPVASVLEEGFEPDILGLFTGNPHGTELAHDNPAPPQILLYINNIWDYSEKDTSVFKEEVRLTYLHELGHYLGWDEDQVSAHGLV